MEFTRRIDAHLEGLRRTHRYRELFDCPAESFVNNDYLGLASHASLRTAALAAAEAGPYGSRGSRLLGGNHPRFASAERAIAAFFEAPSATFFSSGYLANLAAVTALGTVADEILSDEKNHASLIDGIQLTKRPKRIVPHGRWSEVTATGAPLLVTEGLFSMDGDFADWSGLTQVLERTDGFLLVDEAHSAGVFPEDGRGFARRHFSWDRMALVVTFGKAFGVGGAAVIGSARVRELLINTARSFIFSTAASPLVPAMVEASLTLVGESTPLRQELWGRAEKARAELGISAPGEWGPRSPILPWPVPGEERALAFANAMRSRGYDVRAVRYPTVAKGDERIRLSLNLGASRATTQHMVEELKRVWHTFL